MQKKKLSPLESLLSETVTELSPLLVSEHRSYNTYLLHTSTVGTVHPHDPDVPSNSVLFFNSLALDLRVFGPGWTVFIDRHIYFNDIPELMDCVDEYSRQVRDMAVVWN